MISIDLDNASSSDTNHTTSETRCSDNEDNDKEPLFCSETVLESDEEGTVDGQDEFGDDDCEMYETESSHDTDTSEDSKEEERPSVR